MTIVSRQRDSSARATSLPAGARLLRIIGAYILTIPAVLLGCLLTFYWRLDASAALPVLAAGWLIVVAVCARVAGRDLAGVLFFLSVFIVAGHAVTSAILLERMDTLGSVSFDSDDAYYLDVARAARDSVRERPLAVTEHWNTLMHPRHGPVPLSLRGYPFAITYLVAWLPDCLHLHYIAAVSVNLVLFCLLFLAVLYAVKRIHGEANLTALAGLFVLVSINFFFSVAQCRKDVLGVLVLFIACMCLVPWVTECGKISLKRSVALAMCLAVLLTVRTVYIVLPVLMIIFLNLGIMRRLPVKYLFFAGLAAALVVGYFYSEGFRVRGVDLLRWHYGRNYTVLQSGGLGSRLYGIPVLGPFLYYIFTPFPFFDHRAFSVDGVVRNAGFLCFAVTFILLIVARFPAIWSDRILRAALLLMAIFLFMTDIGAALLDDADPRYRMPILPFVCISAYSGLVITRRRRPRQSRSERKRFAQSGERAGIRA